jgi:hypothetical protein
LRQAAADDGACSLRDGGKSERSSGELVDCDQSRKAIVESILSCGCIVCYGEGVAQQTRLTANSRVFIQPTDNGMHTALAGALKKKVPLIVVVSEEHPLGSESPQGIHDRIVRATALPTHFLD